MNNAGERRNSVKFSSWNKRLGMSYRGMRVFTGLVVTAALFAWGIAMAAEPAPLPAAGSNLPKPGPLQPGRSAGVHRAQQTHTGLALVGAGAIIAVVVVAAGTGGNNASGASPQSNSQSVTTTP